jgi:hypothetical protein
MTTELPGGGGDNGGLGGNSVGVGPGVPVPPVSIDDIVPLGVDDGVCDFIDVIEGIGVFVTGPSCGIWVSVISGPGYEMVIVNSGAGYGSVSPPPGAGYPESSLAVSVGVDVLGVSVSVAVAVASGNFVGSVVAVISPPRFMVGEGTPAGFGCPEPWDGSGEGWDISAEGSGYACSVSVGSIGIVGKGLTCSVGSG